MESTLNEFFAHQLNPGRDNMKDIRSSLSPTAREGKLHGFESFFTRYSLAEW
jgi:hypothetical protein